MATEVSNAGAFRVFLGTVGFALGFFGTEYVIEPNGGHRQFGVVLLALALVTEAAAFKWPVIVLRAKSRSKLLAVISISVLVGIVVQRAWDASWVIGAIAGGSILATYVVSVGIAYVVRLRIDLDQYVMPRVITKQQRDAIQKNVQGTGTVTIRANQRDREATAFAHQLLGALRNTNWNVEISTADGLPSTDGEGLRSYIAGQNNAPNRVDPSGEVNLLINGLNKSGILVNGSGGDGAGEYKMFLVVCQRPLVISGIPLRRKAGQWLMRNMIMR